MLTDTHNHTCHFSPDAESTIDDIFAKATAGHLDVIALTEHYEYDNPDPNDNIQTFDLDKYTAEFAAWKKRCPSSLELLMGIEFGYQTHTAGAIDELASKAPFDTVVLSNHLFRGIDVYFSDVVYRLPVAERHAEYMEKMTEMVTNCNNFDVAAHYDYVNKRNPDLTVNMLYEDCPREFDRFFEVLIAKEKALEINTATSARRQSLPDPRIIERYIQMGGRLITVSSDSHVPANIGCMIPEITEFLKSLGVKELCYFKARQPQTYGI